MQPTASLCCSLPHQPTLLVCTDVARMNLEYSTPSHTPLCQDWNRWKDQPTLVPFSHPIRPTMLFPSRPPRDQGEGDGPQSCFYQQGPWRRARSFHCSSYSEELSISMSTKGMNSGRRLVGRQGYKGASELVQGLQSIKASVRQAFWKRCALRCMLGQADPGQGERKKENCTVEADAGRRQGHDGKGGKKANRQQGPQRALKVKTRHLYQIQA